MKQQVLLYGKAACSLCDQVKDDLALLAGEIDLEIREIDITTDPVLQQRYGSLIPVVDIVGGPLLTPPISIRRLRESLGETD